MLHNPDYGEPVRHVVWRDKREMMRQLAGNFVHFAHSSQRVNVTDRRDKGQNYYQRTSYCISCLTSVLSDEVHDMVLSSSVQRFEELDALLI